MVGLTERRLKNKRFKTTEDAIIMAFFLAKDHLCPERIIRLAHISRSTLYRHHKNLHQVVSDYEAYILRENKSVVRRLMKHRHASLKTLYKRILILMTANKRIMLFLSEFGNSNITEQIILILEPKIIAQTKLAREELRIIYVKEISSIIDSWQSMGFNIDEISAVVNKIMFLTDNAYVRLTPLIAFDQNIKSR